MNLVAALLHWLQKPRVTLAILAFLFILPPILAVWSYSHNAAWQRGPSNHGQLIKNPPNLLQSTLDPELFRGHWTIWLVQPNVCDAACKQTLYTITQVKSALGKDSLRLNRLATVINAHDLASVVNNTQDNISKFHVAVLDSTALQQFWHDSIFVEKIEKSGAILIVDPIGNVVMQYAYNEKPSPIFSDLKHLLDVSRIG